MFVARILNIKLCQVAIDEMKHKDVKTLQEWFRCDGRGDGKSYIQFSLDDGQKPDMFFAKTKDELPTLARFSLEKTFVLPPSIKPFKNALRIDIEYFEINHGLFDLDEGSVVNDIAWVPAQE